MKAIMVLEDLDKVDLEMITTNERKFEIEYEDEDDLMNKATWALSETGCWPSFVNIIIEGVKRKWSTYVLQNAYAKGRISCEQAFKYLFADDTIIKYPL